MTIASNFFVFDNPNQAAPAKPEFSDDEQNFAALLAACAAAPQPQTILKTEIANAQPCAQNNSAKVENTNQAVVWFDAQVAAPGSDVAAAAPNPNEFVAPPQTFAAPKTVFGATKDKIDNLKFRQAPAAETRFDAPAKEPAIFPPIGFAAAPDAAPQISFENPAANGNAKSEETPIEFVNAILEKTETAIESPPRARSNSFAENQNQPQTIFAASFAAPEVAGKSRLPALEFDEFPNVADAPEIVALKEFTTVNFDGANAAKKFAPNFNAPIETIEKTIAENKFAAEIVESSVVKANDESSVGKLKIANRAADKAAFDAPPNAGAVSSQNNQFAAGAANGEQVANTIQNRFAPEQIINQLLEIAAKARETREPRAVRLRLRPEESGAIEIRVEQTANGNLNAHIIAETAAAQQVLQQNLEHLRQSLEKANWQIENLTVSSAPFANSDANSRNAHDAPQQNAQNEQYEQVARANRVSSATQTDEKSPVVSTKLVSARV